MAAFNLGVTYNLGDLGQTPDPQRSVDYFRVAAERGDASAYRELAIIYGSGDLGSPDPDEALRLFQTGVDLGNEAVKLELAYARRSGEIIPQDFAIARQLLTELADAGNAEGMANLAVMMELGEGAQVDLEAADKMYKAAMDLGFIESAYLAAWMFADNPDQLDPVRGRAYCIWALSRGTADQVAEWEPKCQGWFGGLDQTEQKAAQRLATSF